MKCHTSSSSFLTRTRVMVILTVFASQVISARLAETA
jgi:hypothetical protein